jgi:hypothetical protein
VLEPEDQILARRIQAREQHVLLAGARQEAAARALLSLGVVDEPALVGVGGRSFDARTTAVETQARAHGGPPRSPDAPTIADDEPVVLDDETDRAVVGPDSRDETPPSDNGTVAVSMADVAELDASDDTRAPTLDEPTPTTDETASADTATLGDTQLDDTPLGDTPLDDEATPVEAAIAAARDDAAPAPHQPTKRPEPGAVPMGTEMPFMEVRGSALGTDIDRIGEKILIFADRVELRDRGNTVKQTIAYGELAGVTIQKKIMGPTLLVQSRSGATMTAKALRPETATGAKAMIEKHARRRLEGTPGAEVLLDTPTAAPPPPSDLELDFASTDDVPALTPLDAAPAATTTATLPAPAPAAPVVESADARESSHRRPHKHVLAAMIDELHAAGILDQSERDAKLALLEVLPPD